MMNSTSSSGVMTAGGYSADGGESSDYRGGNRGAGVSEFAEDADDIIQLQKDVESTTIEANLRINKASDTIRTLKERVARQNEELERLRQGTLAFRQEADTLELDNERISLQLERRARSGIAAPSSDRGEEIKRLRRDAEVLKEQKDALVLILEDLYGSVGKTPPVPNSGAGDEGGAAVPPWCRPQPSRTCWIHL
jgi:regulator of replication initiation timing